MGTYLYHGKKEKNGTSHEDFMLGLVPLTYVVYQSYMYHNTHSMFKAIVKKSIVLDRENYFNKFYGLGFKRVI